MSAPNFFQTKQSIGRRQPVTQRWRWLLAGLVLLIVGLACLPNEPLAQQATPRPTRTKLPTFTPTPLPPSPSPRPSATVTPTETPIPSPTPVPTDTPPATETPLPTATPLPPPPPPPPAPPTPTPPPTATPAPVAEIQSPLATPTNTAVPGSPSGKYRVINTESEPNCAHYGVTGVVNDEDEDRMPNVTVQVTGDEDGFRGPYLATTNGDGEFGLVIGELGKVPTRVEFTAEIYGTDVKTEDRPKWSFNDDCHQDNARQIFRIEFRKG